MRQVVVVVVPPFVDPGAGVSYGQDPRRVQALLAQPAIDRFDVRVVRGLAGSREVEHATSELGAFVDSNGARLAPKSD